MKLLNYKFEDLEGLENFIFNNPLKDRKVFVQIFSGILDTSVLHSILNTIKLHLPDAVVIGATTTGEIKNGRMSDSRIILSFSLFVATQVQTYYFDKTDFESGQAAALHVNAKKTKLCIFLSEGLKNDAQSFLDGFTSKHSDIVVAGGNAGDNYAFTQTYIIKDDKIYDSGIVIALFESEILKVHNAYSLEWTPIGKEMTITRADKNIIYEIDNIAVKDLYSNYLGEETIKRIPASAIEFPLIKLEDGISIARSIIAQTEDGGFVYAGHFKNGEKVRFAIGNVEEILNNAVNIQKDIASKPTEAIYIYSCSVRKLFLQQQLEHELGLLNDIAPNAGMFTYGEFFHSSSNNLLLNITTTAVALSESTHIAEHVGNNKREYHHTMLKSLSHLVNVTQKELDDNIKFLDQYKMVLDESSIVSKTDKKGIITYINDAFCKITGYSCDELIGQSHRIIRHPDVKVTLYADLWKTILSGKVWKGTFKNLSKNGETYYLKSVIAPIFDEGGNITEFIAARVDVTDLIKKEQTIQRQKIDPLTGLKNRIALTEDLEVLGNDVILVVINIDKFSNINDYFGYETGDKLLWHFGQNLQKIVCHEFTYHISSDEFVLICTKQHYDETFRATLIESLKLLEQKRYQTDDYEHQISVTAGIAYDDYSRVYKLAHIAYKEARDMGKKYVFYEDGTSLMEKTHNNFVMLNTIRDAIDHDRVVPFFQGIRDNNSKEITKYEALMRIVDKNGKVLTPYLFLEHAINAKLYEQLTRIMITKTIQKSEETGYDFSINLTFQDIDSKETREFIYGKLKRSNAAHRIIFELVESEGIQNFETVYDFINSIKLFGCRTAIDDFGSGYSNFHYLGKFRADFIKIDGSLIRDIAHNEDHLLTVQSILFFAKAKGIQTIAEFVENEEIQTKVEELGIDYSQGYLFSVPSPEL